MELLQIRFVVPMSLKAGTTKLIERLNPKVIDVVLCLKRAAKKSFYGNE